MSLMPGYPVPSTQWVKSAEECAACGKRFSFFNSKENCPCCGRLFCTKCLPNQCILSPMSKPTAVCVECTTKIQSWHSSQHQQPRQSVHADANANTGGDIVPRSTSMTVLEAKLNLLEEELNSTKLSACQLREENDCLVELLVAKDARLAELKEGLAKGDSSAGAATASGEKLVLQVQQAKEESMAMKRLLKEAEERAANAAQANEVMSTQLHEYRQAKTDSELLAEQLRSAVRQAEDMSAQSLEEVKSLRSSMQAMDTFSEKKIKELSAQLESALAANAQLQQDCDRNVEALRAAEQCRIRSDLQHTKEVERLREQLEGATSALALTKERYEYQTRGEGRSAEVQSELHVADKGLVGSDASAWRTQGELPQTVENSAQLQSNSSLSPQAGSVDASELLTQRKSQERKIDQEEARACARVEFGVKKKFVDELQRKCRDAVLAARSELEGVRSQLSTMKMAYEEGQLSLQGLLGELREMRRAVGRQQASGPAVDASISFIPSERDVDVEKKSRWAQPTIVEDLRYPCVDDVNVHAIKPVTGLDKWEFDTVAEAHRSGEADILLRIGHQIALNLLLFPDEASLHRWVCLLVTVQENYRANPYHNKVHAADVLQGVYALMCQCPSLLEHMTTMEKRAVVFAAAVHDLRHPGRSEAFLRNTFDAIYLRYNGVQVLEQMHTATAFHLLARAELDFTSNDMTDQEALQFHGLVAALIGCTFMGRHASLMEQWSRPLQEGKTYDVTVAADRQQILSLFLHAADLGAQARGLVVSQKWVGVVEEMCAQGDEEAARGLPLSPGGSRAASFERGQLFFLETFVLPLFDLVHQLFPFIDSPIRNLRVVHAHYCAALNETSRAFPPPVQYRSSTSAVGDVEVVPRGEALDIREAALKEQRKAVDEAVRRLRRAAAAVSDRERRLHEREASEKRAVSHSSTQQDERDISTLSAVEDELLRAATAVTERESELERRVAEVDKLTASLEERESIASDFSAQLAAIAEKVNERRQLLSYREQLVQQREEALDREQAVDGSSFDNAAALADGISPGRVSNCTPTDCAPASWVRRVKLESALEKLNGALQYT